MKQLVYGRGPDISYHNGAVDWKQIKESGCRQTGLRAGYGNNHVDRNYKKNAASCRELGIQVMLYWFSYAFTEEMACAEGRYALGQAADYWTGCPIAYDLEYDSIRYAKEKGVVLTRETCTRLAIAFLKEVKTAGYLPVLYTNRDYLLHYFDLERIRCEVEGLYVWYTRYTQTLSEEERNLADVWQYTSKGSMPGVTGHTDLNAFFTDFGLSMSEGSKECESGCLSVLEFQKAANADGYRDMDGKPLQEDGLNGKRTRAVCRKILLQAKKSDGGWQVGSRGALVKWWQGRCNEILSHNNPADGLFGSATRKETLLLQERMGLKKDGITGFNSIQAVLSYDTGNSSGFPVSQKALRTGSHCDGEEIDR